MAERKMEVGAREWSEAEIRKLARDEARRAYDSKRKHLLGDVSIFEIPGKLEFVEERGGVRALIDHFDVAQFLFQNLSGGKRVRLTVRVEDG